MSSSAPQTTNPIKWYTPHGGFRDHQTVHECKIFEIALGCPEDCGGELRCTGESMGANYGAQSYYHACDKCKTVWLVKGARYPHQQYVRQQDEAAFRLENTNTAPKK